MISTRFSLCALPRAEWEQDTSQSEHGSSIHAFVEDALAIERRIQNEVHYSDERIHYNLCCTRIETMISPGLLTSISTAAQFKETLKVHRLPMITLGADYLHILAQIIQQLPYKASKIRLGAMFFPPDTIQAHNVAYYQLAEHLGVATHMDVQRRIAFFHLAHQSDCGVIELQNTFQFLATVEPTHLVSLQHSSGKQEAYAFEEEQAVANGRCNLYSIMRQQIQDAIDAIRAGRTELVNFSKHPHHVITEVLHEFIYKDQAGAGGPISIQVIYADGSLSEAFPLYCLPRRPNTELAALDHSQALHIALMSQRHLEMGLAVEMTLLQNRDLFHLPTLADKEIFCYRLARKQLQETRSKGNLKLCIYQTDFQPAIIGFYRALIDELLCRTDLHSSLKVTPYYFSRKIGYWEGRQWH